MAAVLGVLKAGGAYVPLDPEYPQGRLSFMLEDAQAAVLLTQSSLREAVPAGRARVLCIDEEWGPAPLGAVTAGPGADPRNLAYVIYTSGSTGRPKGVGVTHASAAQYLRWAAEAYGGGEPVRMALYSSVAFDLTVTSLLLPLLTGGAVVACRGAGVEALEAAAVSGGEVLKLTPSHLRLLVGRDLSGAGVRRLVLGGEGLATELAVAAVAAFGAGVEVCNEYGPTEATVGCMLHRFDPVADARAEVPIGWGREGARVYVLEGRLRAAAEGVRGELYIGGGCLARGYYGQPGLTAERFVPDPYAGEAGVRMYRTGDAARRLAGGEVEYLGRVDRQVKVRGVRLELGEVRAALNRHPGVRDSHAVVRAGAGGEAALVCYYAARQAVEVEELRAHMAGELPREAQPAGYVWVRRLPLSLNGKVEERGLPEWKAGGEAGRKYEGPRTAVEEVLCGVWTEVLGVERVGIGDNFFELGGHSLLATQVVSRIREAFAVEVSLRQLFDAPTIAGLAALLEELERARRTQDAEPADAISRREHDERLPLSFAQQRLWFLEQFEPGGSAYNVPAALRLTGNLDVAALERTINEVVRRHEVLRTRFVEADGRPAQVVAPFERRPLPVKDLAGQTEEEREAEVER
ncbi:MAG TPA: amino acid adenylation domain-containing protein, partial [Pyrinomonadaceae bacterium]|nr:amino acid adenylation domain-containing protein [Pyrinomonadaceae bacterium]